MNFFRIYFIKGYQRRKVYPLSRRTKCFYCCVCPQARTQEAEPVGSVGLSAEVQGPRSVRTLWTAPAVPNGQMYYDVFFEGIFYVDPGLTLIYI